MCLNRWALFCKTPQHGMISSLMSPLGLALFGPCISQSRSLTRSLRPPPLSSRDVSLHSRVATAKPCFRRHGPSLAIGGASTELDLSFASLSRAPFAPPAVPFFASRVRCLGHISDNRRPKCAEWLLKHGSAVSPATLVRLDETDRVQRREAQQQALTGPRATLPARNAKGRVVGRPLA